MRKKIIAGNWKMNKTGGEARDLANFFFSNPVNANEKEVVILPPAVYLSEFSAMPKCEGVSLGAQNCYVGSEGAFTGEISAYILKSLGVNYCLVGHSERRTIFGESDLDCREKIKAMLENDITPIYCVGESLALREAGTHFECVKTQLLAVLTSLKPTEISRLTIAYEPVWAIGTGKTASVAQASEMHTFIRDLISGQFDAKIAGNVHLLYGGSVNEKNAMDLLSAKDIDGVLVGGASLKTNSFKAIVDAV